MKIMSDDFFGVLEVDDFSNIPRDIVYVKYDRFFISSNEALELEKEIKRLMPSEYEAT